MGSGPTPPRLDIIRNIVRSSYEDPDVVARYATVGLWPAEEILVADFVPDNARVLDLGCGAGRTTIPLAEMGLQVVGIDISEAMVRAAREQARLAGVEAEFQVMDATSLQYPDAAFDTVLFPYNGIELLPGQQSKEQLLREVWRVLRPGGRFIFSAHSLYAVNAFAPMRLMAFLRLCMGCLFGVPVRERELGERFIDAAWEEAKYLQILPPSRLRKMLVRAGFRLIYFNTRPRLESGRRWQWVGTFEDGERVFVAEKGPVAGPAAKLGKTADVPIT